MARGDVKPFTAYSKNDGLKQHDNSNDVFKWVLVTETYAAQDADATSRNLADFTQVASSGNYTANTTIANTTWTTSGNVTKLDGDSFNFAADASNPTTGRSLIIYNDTDTDKDVLLVVDLTTDGSTAADMTQGFTYTVNAGGILTRTTANT